MSDETGGSESTRRSPAARWREAVAATAGHRRPLLGGLLAGGVLVAFAAIALADRLGGDPAATTAPPVSVEAVEVTPTGSDIARLTPVLVRFAEPPSEQDPASLVSLEPGIGGSYEWADEQTLLFQPDFPGYERGATYSVRVHAGAAGLQEDLVRSFQVAGALTVDYVIPGDGDTEVPADAQVLVQFSRAVAPLTTLAARGDDPVVTFDPPLAGTGEWLNTSLYRFTPDEVDPSTTYRLRIPAGLTSAADGVLEADFEWSFTTYGPSLASSDPADNTQFVGRNRDIVLRFNQPMRRTAVEQGVSVRGPAGTVDGTFSWSDGGTTVTLDPAQPLALSTRYEVVVPAGLPGEAGGTTAAERTVAFTTSDLPSLVRSEPANGATDASRFGIWLTFNNPMDIESIEERLSISGIDPEDIRLDSFEGREVRVDVSLQPSTSYRLSIADGATDRDGLPLGPVSVAFTTGALPSSVSFAVPSQLATYSSSVEPVLFFHATNVDQAGFELYELSQSEARMVLDRGHIPHPPTNQLWRPSSDPIREWSVPLQIERDVVSIGSTSLSGNGGPLPAGDYYVRGTGGDYRSALFFSVVDAALVTKLSQDELLVWALDLDSGEPLSGVTLAASGPGLGSSTATTGADGLASFSVPGHLEVRNTERAYVVRLDDGEHRGVASTRWRNNGEPWQIGIPGDYPREYVGHLYTDRPIYRPGETVNYKAVVRLDDDADYRIPDASPGLQLIIRNPQYEEISRTPVTLNEFGTFAGEFALPSEAATGGYFLEISGIDPTRHTFVASTYFTVAEFRVPEFRVEVETDAAEYIDGETIEATAAGSFYFGGPVEGASVTYAVLAYPTSIRVEDYERYSFADYDFYQRSVLEDPLRAEGSMQSDEDGTATFTVDADLLAETGTHEFQISATLIDDNGRVAAGGQPGDPGEGGSAQAVSANTSVRVHPAAYYAGIAPASYVAEAGQPATIDLVTVDTQGDLAPDRQVTVRVYEREWITTKEQTEDGARRYVSEPRDTLLATIPTTTGAGAEGSVEYTPEASGTLRLVAEVTDEQGRVSRSAAYLWVSGSGRASWQVRNDDVIELVADRESYEVGDTAEVLVPAPVEGAVGLVTLERGKVISRSVREFATTSETLSIPIEDGHVPNVFVSVVLYRPPTAEDPLPRYKIGYVELPVSSEPRQLTVAIEPSTEQAEPGESVTYDIDVTDWEGRGVAAELSVSVVDEAVLALREEVGPDGLGAFWYQRGLIVETASSLAVSIDRSNDVIREPETGGKGGGGDNDALRQDFRNTAYWEAQVETDESGHATVTVPLPDNLTTWRTQVRAVSGDTMVGESTSELLVTKPLLLRPAFPRFLRVGDQVTLRALLRNGTDEAVTAGVTLEAEGVQLQGEATQNVTVQPGDSVAVGWPATATSAGTARLTVSAEDDAAGLSDALRLELPVHLDVTPETTATGGQVTDDPKVEAIYLPEFALAEGGSLEVSVQGSLVGMLNGELYELRRLPRESNQRTAARLLATIAAQRAAEPEGEVTGIAGDVASLVASQRGDGGWGWCRECRTNADVTAWVLLALGEAHRAGTSIEGSVFARAAGVLRAELSRPSDVEAPADPNREAFFLYAMASGASTPATVLGSQMRSIVEQDRARLTDWGRAYLLAGLERTEGDGEAGATAEQSILLNDLAASAISSANGNHWEAEQPRGSLHSNVRTTALVLHALSLTEPRHPQIDETVRWLTTARAAADWETEVDRAQSLAALGAYAVATGDTASDYAYAVRLEDRVLLEGEVTPSADAAAQTEVPLTDLARGINKIAFGRDAGGAGRLYYALNFRYLTPAQQIEALNRGFAVSHEYTMLDDPERPVTQAPMGEIVRVTMTVVAPADRKFVMLEDFLPAGLEPIDPQLATVPLEVREQLERERRDAILGDSPPAYFAPWFAWYYNPWEQVDVRDDRVTLLASELPAGVHTYVYYARATTPGDFFVAPPHIEEANFPEVFGRGDSGRFTVR